MTLPIFWRRASFAVSETADLIGVTEETLRTWLARNITNDFNGAKTGGRIWLSGQDAFYFLLVKEMTGYGVSVRLAMSQADFIANTAAGALPLAERLVVRKTNGKTSFELVDDADFKSESALVIPLRSLAVGLIERAAVIYIEEAG